MAIRDLNAEVGTVTRDTGRHVGPGGDWWVNPTLCNDGNSGSRAYVSSSLNAFQDFLKADLGAVYRVSAFKWYLSNTAANVDLPQWSADGTTWNTIAFTESGGRSSSPDGATLTFDGGPIDARYWAMRAVAGGFHSSIYLNTWQIMGDDIEGEPPPEPPVAEEWDIYAEDDLNGPIIATLQHATERNFRVEEDGTGFGSFVINRHASEATAAILAKGNLVRVRIPEISDDYIFAFFLEQGDFTLLSPNEQGGEVLRFGGRGALAYLDRARMIHESYTTDPTVTDVWEQVWRTGAIRDPVGSAVVGGDATYVYVISATTRKVYKIRQSDRAIVRSSPPLWTGADNYAGGLGADPADSTILWVLEAPWSLGGAGNTKIRKVRISDWAILNTFNLGSATKLTEVKADSSNLWTSRYENTNTIQKRSKADGSVVTNYDISYGGVTQVLATGISVNGTQLAYWYSGKKRALIASSSAPTTITDKITTTGLSAFGGDWTTEGAIDYFYPVSYTADVVWKYALNAVSPSDPVDGEWRLDELTPGAILWRIIAEAQAGARAVQPIPETTMDFDSTDDSTSDPWDTAPGTVEFTASVGDLVLETALRLIPFGLTIQMSPMLDLQAYNEANFGTNRANGSFAAGKVRLLAGTNIADETQRRLDDRRVDSWMLAQGEGNRYATAVDDDLGYQREGFLSTALTSAEALEGSAEAELARERDVSEAIRLVLTWGNSELAGLYMPGPDGSNGHYWVGDIVRVHTGTGEFDLNEQDLAVKAISVSELPNGQWEAVVELMSGFLPLDAPTGGGSGSSDIGGSGGAGTTTSAQGVTVKDTVSGDAFTGSTIESDDWGVFQAGQRRVGVSIRSKKLRELLDVELDAIVDGQGIAWDADLEAWLPVYLSGLGWFNIADYGALIDGSTDDTAAVQAAIDAAYAAGGGTIYHPGGLCVIGGALQDTGAFNAQLLLPDVATSSSVDHIVLTFRGALRPGFHPLYGDTVPLAAGLSVYKSTLTGATGTAAAISGGNDLDVGDANNLEVNIQDLVCLGPDNPTFTFWNLSACQGGEVNGLQISTPGAYVGTPTLPTNTNAYGIKLPVALFSNSTKIDGLAAGGFYTGVQWGELAVSTGPLILGPTYYGIEIPLSYYPGFIVQLTATSVVRVLRYTGAPSGHKASHGLDILQYVRERPGSGSFDTEYDVYDPSDYGQGYIRWYTISAAGGGSVDTFLRSGGASVGDQQIGEDWGTGGAGDVATDAIWDAAGDLAVGTGADAAARLAKGNAGGVLAMGNSAVIWNAGTSFPASKATGDRYYRTDIGAEYTWDGTNWVSTVPYYYPLGTAVDQGIAASAILHRAGVPPAPDIYVYGFYTTFFVAGGTALAAGHKWVGTVNKTGGTTVTSMGTITIDSGASSSWREAGTLAINALMAVSTYKALEISWVKTGTPGPLYAHVVMVYRNVAT